MNSSYVKSRMSKVADIRDLVTVSTLWAGSPRTWISLILIRWKSLPTINFQMIHLFIHFQPRIWWPIPVGMFTDESWSLGVEDSLIITIVSNGCLIFYSLKIFLSAPLCYIPNNLNSKWSQLSLPGPRNCLCVTIRKLLESNIYIFTCNDIPNSGICVYDFVSVYVCVSAKWNWELFEDGSNRFHLVSNDESRKWKVWRDSAMGKTFALHMANLELVQALPGVIPEKRASNKLLGTTLVLCVCVCV